MWWTIRKRPEIQAQALPCLCLCLLYSICIEKILAVLAGPKKTQFEYILISSQRKATCISSISDMHISLRLNIIPIWLKKIFTWIATFSFGVSQFSKSDILVAAEQNLLLIGENKSTMITRQGLLIFSDLNMVNRRIIKAKK